MFDEVTGHERPAPRKKSFRMGRSRSTPRKVCSDLLRLASSERLVEVLDTMDHPLTAMLAAEDAVWEFRRADWLARKPRLWQLGRRRSWQEEGRRIEQKRLRLVELTSSVRSFARVS